MPKNSLIKSCKYLNVTQNHVFHKKGTAFLKKFQEKTIFKDKQPASRQFYLNFSKQL